ncbi:MAG: FAD-dependent oxidoreductase, partial [Chloroflexota bacterium]|nr:FAD-dependent oxidoreductase [Chloroflexota bacterium]
MSDPPRADGRYRAIVVGSGMAGLFAALEASALGPVLLVTKGELHEGSTRHAQGGIAAAIGPDDSTEQHLKDTIAAGAGLVDEAMARILVESAPRRIRDLERYGVSFDSEGANRAFGREGAHRNARVL